MKKKWNDKCKHNSNERENKCKNITCAFGMIVAAKT